MSGLMTTPPIPSLAATGAQTLVQSAEPDLAMACALGPAPAQPALYTLAAFHHEVAKTPEVTSEPITGQIRLQWWRDALQNAADPAGNIPEHEVARPLGQLIRSGRVDAASLLALIDAREADLEPLPHNTEASLDAYLAASWGRMMQQMASLCGADISAATVETLACAYGRVGLIRAFPAHWRQRRTALPLETFQAQGLTDGTLFDHRPAAAHAAAFAALGEPAVDSLRRLKVPRRRAALPLEALRRLALAHGLRLARVEWDLTRLPPLRLPPGTALGLMLSRWTRC